MKYIVFLILLACSSSKDSNQKKFGHEKLYSHPDKIDWAKLEKFEKRIILVATNDLLGNYQAQTEKIKDLHSPYEQLQTVGGLQATKWYIDTIKAKTKTDLFMVDSGQWLPGSQMVAPNKNEGIFQLFKDLPYKATTLGQSDLISFPAVQSDLHLDQWLKPIIEKSPIPVIATNLMDIRKNQFPDWKNLNPSKLIEVNKLQIGIMGVIPPSIAVKLDPLLMNGYYLEPLLLSIMKEARSLKNRGADIVVLLINETLDCSMNKAKKLDLPPLKVNFDFKNSQDCNHQEELAKVLQKLTPGLVDIVVGGGMEAKVANLYHNMMVIQSPGQGKYFSWIDIVYDTRGKTINLDKSQIFQPIKICHTFFSKTEDCYHEDNTIDHREIEQAVFLGEEFPKNLPLSSSLSPIEDQEIQSMALPLEKFSVNHLLPGQYILPTQDLKKLKYFSVERINDTLGYKFLNDFIVELTVSEKNKEKFSQMLGTEFTLVKNQPMTDDHIFFIPFGIWDKEIKNISAFLNENQFRYLTTSVSHHFMNQSVRDQISTIQAKSISNTR